MSPETSDMPAKVIEGSGGVVERFNAFYEFAFPRVYRYALRRMRTEAEAQVLCRLVLIRAMTSLGGLEAIASRMNQDPVEFAYGLFCLARQTADHLCAQLDEDPERALVEAGCEFNEDIDGQAFELLRSARSTR